MTEPTEETVELAERVCEFASWAYEDAAVLIEAYVAQRVAEAVERTIDMCANLAEKRVQWFNGFSDQQQDEEIRCMGNAIAPAPAPIKVAAQEADAIACLIRALKEPRR